jgi:hypothetical protein
MRATMRIDTTARRKAASSGRAPLLAFAAFVALAGGSTGCDLVLGLEPGELDTASSSTAGEGGGGAPATGAIWSVSLGSAQVQRVVAGPNGPIVAGAFTGSLNTGGEVLTAAGSDFFLVGLDTKGRFTSSRRFGGPGDESFLDIAADDDGIVLTGNLAGSIDLGGGGGPITGGDRFVAKLTHAGGHVFSYPLPGTVVAHAAIGGAGRVAVAGWFDGAAEIDAMPLSGVGQESYFAFVAAAGGVEYAQAFGGPGEQAVTAAAVDTGDNLVLGGYFDGGIELGGSGAASAGGYDMYLAKVDPIGNLLWLHGIGGAAHDFFAGGLQTGADGSVFAATPFRGSIDVAGTEVTSVGASDVFVARFDPDGTLGWVQRFGDVRDQTAVTLAPAPDGGVVLAGVDGGATDFGAGAHERLGESDLFVAWLDRDGRVEEVRRFGAPGVTFDAITVDVDSRGAVYVSGVTNGPVDFGRGAIGGDEGGGFVIELAR